MTNCSIYRVGGSGDFSCQGPTRQRRLPFQERARLCKNPTAERLCEFIHKKRSNLAVSADFTSAQKLLHFANLIGPYISVLKTHVDILEDFSKSFLEDLLATAQKYSFLLFEDRKFADIGSISEMQYAYGIYQIANWADIITAHSISGPGIIEGLKERGRSLKGGLLLLAEMSSAGNLAHGPYTDATVKMALEHPDFVIGFITQHRLVDDPSYLHFTPGVKLSSGRGPLGQQYRTPERAIFEEGCDLIIVGRGITEAADPRKEAERYRDSAYSAYGRQ